MRNGRKTRCLALWAGVLLAALLLPWGIRAAQLIAERDAVSADGTAEITGEPEAETDTPKLIALTFDDGPSSVTTPMLLDGLAERGVHATFFLVGSMVENSPDVVLRMVAEGHQIGVHTYDHSSSTGFKGLSAAQFDAQVGVTQRLLTQLTGQTEFALRPPYGYVDDGVRQRAIGPIVLWSIDPEDWRDQSVSQEVEHIVSHAQDGAIILMHDIFWDSVQTALQVVDRLHQEGYYFVTVDELFAARGIELVRGQVYHSAGS